MIDKKIYKNNYSIIIPTFNSENTIEACLNSVKKVIQKYDIEVIVCDNNSTDNTFKIISKYPFKILINKKKQSASSTRNYAAKYSKFENLIFLDSDCILPFEFISILEKTENFGFAKCIAGNFSKKNIYKNFFSLYKTSYVHNKLRNQRKNVLNSGIMFIKKKYFFTVGMFNENMTSMEDDEFSIKFQKNGYEIIFNKDLEVDHYKKYNFFTLTKNDFLRSKVLAELLVNNIKYRKIKNYDIWVRTYIKYLLNCIILLLNIIFISEYFLTDFFLNIGKNEILMFFLFCNLIYLVNNIDVIKFNYKNYNLKFSIYTVFFQFFTYLTIITGLVTGFLGIFFNFLKKKLFKIIFI